MDQPYSEKRGIARYVILLLLVAALCGGWSAFWYMASGKIEATIEGWRAREAQAGRLYACGSQTIGGYPFRFELNCDDASALFKSSQPPIEVKSRGVLVAAQVYEPTLLISEFHGPLTISSPGQAPEVVVNWKLAQSSLRGTPAAPERMSFAVDLPVVDGVSGGTQKTLWRARRFELHGRLAEGSVRDHPVIEAVLRLNGATAEALHPVAAMPVDADITAMLRGLSDFSPKSWQARFREIQAAGGGIEITQARVEQGDTLAVGSGTVTVNASGRLDGQLQVTVAGLEQFLAAIGAQQMVQQSPGMDRLAGVLDRVSPGLGGIARQQAAANIGAG
ncbi:MAG TPA: DUF2125 domain-containing protein, partial [Pseudolabrys sp.]